MLDYDVSTALDTDYYGVFDEIPDSDREVWMRARMLSSEVLPDIAAYWEKAEYPLHFLHRMGDLNLLSDGVDVPGIDTLSPLAAGLASMEINRTDGSLGTVVAVQGGLALRTISLFGSEEHKDRWLKPLATGETYGAWALTEPEHGSDSAGGLETTAVRDGDHFVINGAKKWIGNGSTGGVTVVWAKDEQSQVRAFLVEQDTPGYEATTITGKMSLRAIHQAEIQLINVRVPVSALLPGGTHSFKDASRVLLATRSGVAWAALGHATAVYEAALCYAKQRIQFGKPLAKFQLVQERLVQMLAELTSMQLLCLRMSALDAAGKLRPTQASLAKYNNTRKARNMASMARDMLGGNGILLENHVIRHLLDLEALHTYEGTESIQALLIGRDVTGESAFS